MSSKREYISFVIEQNIESINRLKTTIDKSYQVSLIYLLEESINYLKKSLKIIELNNNNSITSSNISSLQLDNLTKDTFIVAIDDKDKSISIEDLVVEEQNTEEDYYDDKQIREQLSPSSSLLTKQLQQQHVDNFFKININK